MNKPISPFPQTIAERAVEFYLDAQNDDIDTGALHHWLMENDQHQAAWDHITSTNKKIGLLSTTAAQKALLTPPGIKRRQALKSLAILLFGSAGIGYAYRNGSMTDALADIRTGIGERDTILLSNGTLLNINTDSSLNIEETNSSINLHLLKGEIMLTTSFKNVIQSHKKMISVKTEHGTLSPLGTVFSVHTHRAKTDVSVFEGNVAATSSNTALFSSFNYKQGSFLGNISSGNSASLMATSNGVALSNVRQNQPSDNAWVDGVFVAANTSLEKLLTTIKRHRRGYLSWDKEISELSISGTFPLDDTDKILATLERHLPVRVQRISRYWVRILPEDN